MEKKRKNFLLFRYLLFRLKLTYIWLSFNSSLTINLTQRCFKKYPICITVFVNGVKL